MNDNEINNVVLTLKTIVK